VIALPYIQEAIMPNAYHHVFFTVRDGVSDHEVLDTIRRYRELAVSKGYIQHAHDVSIGTVVRYIRESPPDIQAVNFFGLLTQPPHFMAHDHVDQSA
jgi:hypothetical protein